MPLSNWTKVKVRPWRHGSAIACVIISAVSLAIAPTPQSWGQVPGLPKLNEVERVLIPRPASDKIATGTVRLDGHQLFEIAVPAVSDTQQKTKTGIKQRVQAIETRLEQIAKRDFDPKTLQVTSRTRVTQQGEELPVIYVDGQYLMTVTALDADMQGSDLSTLADEWSQIVKEALIRAKQERQPESLQRQGTIAAGVILAMIVGGVGISRRQRHLKAQRKSLLAHAPTDSITSPFAVDTSATNPITLATMQEKMTWRRQRNLIEVQRRLHQVGQAAIWGGGTFLTLGLFPYTRWLQPLTLFVLDGPLKIIGIGLGTYVVIRISAVLIDQFFQALQPEESPPSKDSQRFALRISTFSLVLKRTTAFVLIGIGTLGALSAVGINVAPLLAGVGIIGLALSFASQNLIKDVINGFLILSEDQYAVGDVIVVGDVGGLVENMNLRITQLRNDEGRLITIPNSEISVVENLSKDWSRVDLKIYVAGNTDLDQAFKVIEQVGLEMSRERTWRKRILESPEVLGVDELKYTGIMIRVWIKTQPLEQWNVAREYRRRLKLALDQQGISIGMPQQSIRFQNSLDLTNKGLNGDDRQELHKPMRRSDHVS